MRPQSGAGGRRGAHDAHEEDLARVTGGRAGHLQQEGRGSEGGRQWPAPAPTTSVQSGLRRTWTWTRRPYLEHSVETSARMSRNSASSCDGGREGGAASPAPRLVSRPDTHRGPSHACTQWANLPPPHPQMATHPQLSLGHHVVEHDDAAGRAAGTRGWRERRSGSRGAAVAAAARQGRGAKHGREAAAGTSSDGSAAAHARALPLGVRGRERAVSDDEAVERRDAALGVRGVVVLDEGVALMRGEGKDQAQKVCALDYEGGEVGLTLCCPSGLRIIEMERTTPKAETSSRRCCTRRRGGDQREGAAAAYRALPSAPPHAPAPRGSQACRRQTRGSAQRQWGKETIQQRQIPATGTGPRLTGPPPPPIRAPRPAPPPPAVIMAWPAGLRGSICDGRGRGAVAVGVAWTQPPRAPPCLHNPACPAVLPADLPAPPSSNAPYRAALAAGSSRCSLPPPIIERTLSRSSGGRIVAL